MKMDTETTISVMRARIKNLENGQTIMKEAIKTLADEIWGKD